ncbi:MAG: flavodoxin family protein, partial [Clostridiales bacterium]|nr:flavodoxin family protein [Clostridiales bacterium]
VRAFLQREGIMEAGCRLFDAYDARPLPCIDCGWCKTRPGCALPDLKDFYRDFEAARLVIIATPVYNAALPAPLKAVVDRMQTYFNARFSRDLRPPIPTSKRAALLFTAGSERDYRPLLREQLAPLFTVTNCKLHGAACLSGLDRRPADNQRITSALSEIPPLSFS